MKPIPTVAKTIKAAYEDDDSAFIDYIQIVLYNMWVHIMWS